MNLNYLREINIHVIMETHQILRQLKDKVERLVGLHHCSRTGHLLCLQMVQRLEAYVVTVADNCDISLLCLW